MAQLTPEEIEAKLEEVAYYPKEKFTLRNRQQPGDMDEHHRRIVGEDGRVQQLYYEEYGNPKGEPVFVLHGGPGYGTSSDYARYYNPDFYHIIVFEQRNARRSQPSANEPGELAHCTSEQMMHDINKLAETFGVDFSGKDPAKHHRIHLMGGSWGSTLGMYYGAHFPERLYSLTLRATWMAQASAVNKLHEYETAPDGTITDVPQLKAFAGKNWERCEHAWNEFADVLTRYQRYLSSPEMLKQPTLAYHELLNNVDVPLKAREEAAFQHIMLEHVSGDMEHSYEWVAQDVNKSMTKEQQLSYARIENNFEVALMEGRDGFFAKKGNPDFNWFTDGRTPDGKMPMAAMADIPLIRIVHGQQDNVCSPEATEQLVAGLKQEMLRKGRRATEKVLSVERPENSGHMLGDLGISTAMRKFTDGIMKIREAMRPHDRNPQDIAFSPR